MELGVRQMQQLGKVSAGSCQRHSAWWKHRNQQRTMEGIQQQIKTLLRQPMAPHDASSPQLYSSITQDAHFSDEPDFAPPHRPLLGGRFRNGWWGNAMSTSAFMAPSISKIAEISFVTPVKGPQRVVSLDHPNGARKKAW